MGVSPMSIPGILPVEYCGIGIPRLRGGRLCRCFMGKMPMPRPFPKSGNNAIQAAKIVVTTATP